MEVVGEPFVVRFAVRDFPSTFMNHDSHVLTFKKARINVVTV